MTLKASSKASRYAMRLMALTLIAMTTTSTAATHRSKVLAVGFKYLSSSSGWVGKPLPC